jgi:hypothetical protein
LGIDRDTIERFRAVIRHAGETLPDAPGAPPNVWALVARDGQSFEGQTLPKRYRRGATGDCYGASLRRALAHKELTYVEGFASTARLGYRPIRHAWCSDGSGKAIDSTWEDGEEAVYLGLSIPSEQLVEFIGDPRPILDQMLTLRA